MPSSNKEDRRPVALVTGGTTGIGLVTCQQLATKGVDVVLTSRSDDKGRSAVADIQPYAAHGSTVRYVIMELSNLQSVAAACETLLNGNNKISAWLDYLILNAGIMGTPGSPMATSADGVEEIVAVNHVAGYYLVHRLLPWMEQTAQESPLASIRPMITLVSSDLHNIHSPTGAAKTLAPIVIDDVVRFCSQQKGKGIDATAARQLPPDHAARIDFHPVWSYKYSKLLNILTAQALHEQLTQRQSKVSCNSMEPGFIPQSDLSRGAKSTMGPFLAGILMWNLYHGPLNWLARYMLQQPVRTVDQGAASEVYAVMEGQSGQYYRLDHEDPPSPLVREKEVVMGIYDGTAELLKEKGFPVTTL